MHLGSVQASDWMFCAILLLFMNCVSGSLSAKEGFRPEGLPPQVKLVQSGVVCDTRRQVIELLNTIENDVSPDGAVRRVSGCGFVRRPFLATVVPIEEYVTSKAKYLIVRYDIIALPGEVQYGVHSFIPLDPTV